MSLENYTSTGHSPKQDPLAQYAGSVAGLSDKLARILSSNQDTANSLMRAAAALRSMSSSRK